MRPGSPSRDDSGATLSATKDQDGQASDTEGTQPSAGFGDAEETFAALSHDTKHMRRSREMSRLAHLQQVHRRRLAL